MDQESTGSFSLKSYLKFVVAFLAIIFFGFGGYIAWRVYDLKRGMQDVEGIAQEFEKAEKEAHARALADTYGGKTPQETLQMYIDAVEKGDYELASKYFIEENQEKELLSFKTSKASSLQKQEYINSLKLILDKTGKYDESKKYFSFDGNILVEMSLYPSGVWKIIEI